ncbi:MAG: aminotransferase class V-fold PLP-dependent enzyme [Myxococcota bacterium]
MEPVFGDRTLFPDLTPFAYLNHAAVSPPSLRVRAAAQALLDNYAAHGVGAVMETLDQRERLRARLAGLIRAQPDDIGFVANTSAGVTAVALGLRWNPGDRILLFDGEFPTNITPWQRAAQTFDLKTTFLSLDGFTDGSGDGLAQLEGALKVGGVRLVAVSAVQFQTGLRMPTAEMAALCHRYGARLFVDGIQAIGAVPFDARAVDFMACGSHKWMMGLEGCGFLFVHPDAIDDLAPRVASWLSHDEGCLDFLFEGPGHLDYDRPIRRQASFVEGGAPNALGFVALEAAADVLAALTVPAIYQHANAYLDALEPGLIARGFVSHRAADPNRRSCILSTTVPEGVDLKALHTALGERGVSVSTPDGRLRFSPHWPNREDEIAPLLAALDESLRMIRRVGLDF